MPRSLQPTLAWVETMNAVLQKPMPTPRMKAPLPAQKSPLAGVNRMSMRLPATRQTPPIDADRRYEVRINRGHRGGHVSTQASVGWNDRGMATSSMMFMRIVGQSVGAAVFGAILNFGVYRLLPEAGDAVNRLMSPAARQGLGASEIERLTEAVGSSLHVVYMIAGLVALVSLILALALPPRLSPTRPRRGA